MYFMTQRLCYARHSIRRDIRISLRSIGGEKYAPKYYYRVNL